MACFIVIGDKWARVKNNGSEKDEAQLVSSKSLLTIVLEPQIGKTFTSNLRLQPFLFQQGELSNIFFLLKSTVWKYYLRELY